jgi:segregation and condensation protein B
VNRKRGKRQKAAVAAIPDDILAEGSAPVRQRDTIETVEAVVTTEDIATTDDVVTADDVVATHGARVARDSHRGSSVSDAAARVSAAELEVAELEVAELEVVELEAGELEAGELEAGELEAGELEAGELEGAELEGAELEGAELEAGELEGAELEAVGEDDVGPVFPTSAATMDAAQLKHLVEALIFAADRPLTVQRLRQLTRVGAVRRLEQALAELAEDYRDRGLVLQQVSGGYQFRTRTQFSAWVQQLIAGRPVRLSRAQLETLAIIAYRQPITRPEIDDIRGVDSSATLKLLIDRMLIRVLGKREEVGRPMLYGTTKEFLDFFSLGDLRELPTLREYSELTAESRKVMSDRLGIAADGGDGGDGGDGRPGFSGDGLAQDGGDSPGASASDLGDALGACFAGGDAVDPSVAPDEAHRTMADAAVGDDDLAEGAAADAAAESTKPEVVAGQASGLDAVAAVAVAAGAARDPACGPGPAVDAEPVAARTSDGQDDGVDAGGEWAFGSPRRSVIAPSDDRPVERPAMEPQAMEAAALDDRHGAPAVSAAPHAEPVAE